MSQRARSTTPPYITRSVGRKNHARYLERHKMTQEQYDAEQLRWKRQARGKNSPDPDSDPEVTYEISRKKTRSMQRERRERRIREQEAGTYVPKQEKHPYTPDYRFYIKGGDLFLVVENILFCVHAEKLCFGGGFIADVLKNENSTEQLRGRPVIHLPLVDLVPMRYYLAYLYRTITLTRMLPSGTPLLYWDAAISVLLVSHQLDNGPAREAALKALEAIFPYSKQPVPFKPAIAGLRTKEQETNFYRTFPLEAITVLRQCDVNAMLPMAFYHAAQLPAKDLTEGVKVGEREYKLNPEDAELAMTGYETLANARKNLLFAWLPQAIENSGPRKVSPKCADLDLRGGLACHAFLVRLREQTLKAPHNTATHSLQTFSDDAKEVIVENICFQCLELVLELSEQRLETSWKALPGCFGFEPWDVLIEKQRKTEEAWAGNFN